MRKGFTILETMVATSLTAVITVAAISSWTMFLHKSNKTSNQAMLDMDARRVVEQFRHEVRNAARETIMFYPEDKAPYLALGFALARDTDNDGLMDMDASGENILWRETVIYHLWHQSDPPEMRRTIFSNRNNDASREDYYTQLATVAKLGDGATACLSGERAKTRTMFSNMFTGNLWHAAATFDGYSPTPDKREDITFGSMALKPGRHQLDMIITGKNPDSKGMALKVDQLGLGVSGWKLETENRELTGALGSTVFTGPNIAGGAYSTYAATGSAGDTLSVILYNDAIEEVEFIGMGRNISLSNAVVNFDTDYTPDDRSEGSYATMLDGQFATAWDAAIQTAGRRDQYVYATNSVLRIPVMAEAVLEDGYGPVFRLYKSYYNGSTDITYPYFEYKDRDITIPLKFYQNGEEKANWAACAAMSYVELRPENTILINKYSTLDLILNVRIKNYGYDRLTAFTMRYPNRPGSVLYTKKNSSTINFEDNYFNLSDDVISKNFNITTNYTLPLLESMAVGYADQGRYVSHIYNTRSFKAASKSITWEADIPAGAQLEIYTRSGDKLINNGFDLEDAPDWSTIAPTPNGGTINGAGRFVQFMAVMKGQPTSTAPGISGGTTTGPYISDTPRLNRVFMSWDGEEKYVDINGSIMKSPDCGIFKVEVDGKPLIRGVTMEIEIFKDIMSMGKKKGRLKSTMVAEIEPRNSKHD